MRNLKEFLNEFSIFNYLHLDVCISLLDIAFILITYSSHDTKDLRLFSIILLMLITIYIIVIFYNHISLKKLINHIRKE